ncbi:hypothetical protein FACS189459_2860 [Bacilli bacterium]|nr:hypothetical protein FACS189459_2860 [Bacilli bacterium]GHU51728.1 hypothetical protein FACS189496_0570 [Bacilli bacterium]
MKINKKNNKPYLIELNHRAMGGHIFLQNKYILNKYSFNEAIFLFFFAQEKIIKEFSKKMYNVGKNELFGHYTNATESYKINSIADKNDIVKKLKTCVGINYLFSVGEILPLTTNFDDFPCEVELLSTNDNEIKKDCKKIDELMKQRKIFIK